MVLNVLIHRPNYKIQVYVTSQKNYKLYADPSSF